MQVKSGNLSFRLAKGDDIPLIVELAREGHLESVFGLFVFNDEQVETSARNLIQMNKSDAAIFIVEADSQVVGMLAAVKSYGSTTLEEFANILVWYVKPEYRKTRAAVLLFDALEYWASEVAHVSGILVGNQITDQFKTLKDFYERHDYRLVEQTYLKELD